MQKLSTHQLIHHRRRVLHEAESIGVTATSRRYGITRQTIYAWRRGVTLRKRGPRTVAWRTDAATERKIIALRQATNYGPKRLVYECRLLGLTVGEKAIRGVIARAGLVRSHRKKRVRTKQKFYAPYPGYRVQIDTKVVPDDQCPDWRRSGGRFQFTAIDIATRIRFLRIYDELSNTNSIEFLKLTLNFFVELGIKVECIQTDNHATFTNVCVGGNKKADHALRRVHPFT